MSQSESFKLRIPVTDLAHVRSSAERAGISVAEVIRRGAIKEAERIISSLGVKSVESADSGLPKTELGAKHIELGDERRDP